MHTSLYLEHHGIKGQKWYIRRYQNKDGTLTPAGKKRYDNEYRRLKEEKRILYNKKQTAAKLQKLDDIKKANDELRKELKGDKKSDEKASESKKPKNISDLSDEELKARIERMRIEKDYINAEKDYITAQTTLSELQSAKVSAGQKFAEKIIKDDIIPAIVDVGRKSAEAYLKKTLNLDNSTADALKKESDRLKREADDWTNRQRIDQVKEYFKKKEDGNTSDKRIKHSDEGSDFFFVLDELKHHGIKGQKWGVRRYQYADGTYTPVGRKRYRIVKNSKGVMKATAIADMELSELTKYAKTQITGKQYVDTCIKKNTTLSRVQSSENFENFAFYATYKKQDVDEYLGLFGKNLTSRANAAAKQAEKKANISGSEEDLKEAKDLRDYSDNLKVYQLKIDTVKKLKIPSDENAGHITANLLKDPEFKMNVEASIADSKEKMRRPTQQMLFNQAQKVLKVDDPDRLTPSEKIIIYKALNLSLTNHNKQEIAAQDRFYSELKKKGYNALLDYNDKEFSSYHAKRPIIVFDTDSVKLQSVTEADPELINKLNKKYNAYRMKKEIYTNTISYTAKFGSMKISECNSYLTRRMDDYLNK